MVQDASRDTGAFGDECLARNWFLELSSVGCGNESKLCVNEELENTPG